jgi:hypothetical protein
MVKILGGNAILGVALGCALVALGLLGGMKVLTIVGVYVFLVSAFRVFSGARGDDD